MQLVDDLEILRDSLAETDAGIDHNLFGLHPVGESQIDAGLQLAANVGQQVVVLHADVAAPRAAAPGRRHEGGCGCA
jgi:hypothetical protein